MMTAEPFLHPAVLYRGEQEYLAALVPFIRDGVEAGDPVAVAVPGPQLRLLQDELGSAPVRWIDMTVAGRNPGYIIPGVLRAFADRHQDADRVRIVGEPIWPSRSKLEYPACLEHEALINLAFTGRAVTILCPYDAERLAPSVLVDAAATHPVLVDHEGERTSAAFAPEKTIESCNKPLDSADPHPADSVSVLRFDAANLAQARHFAAERAAHLGLETDRIPDLEVAVNELAANSLIHGGGHGTLELWADAEHLLCQVSDRGHFTNPLAGRIPAGLGSDGGRGLLLVHQIADLVRIHTNPGRVTIRLHFALRPALQVSTSLG